MKPTELSAKELDKMVRAATFAWVADWLNAYVGKEQLPADKETLRLKWMADICERCLTIALAIVKGERGPLVRKEHGSR